MYLSLSRVGSAKAFLAWFASFKNLLEPMAVHKLHHDKKIKMKLQIFKFFGRTPASSGETLDMTSKKSTFMVDRKERIKGSLLKLFMKSVLKADFLR